MLTIKNITKLLTLTMIVLALNPRRPDSVPGMPN